MTTAIRTSAHWAAQERANFREDYAEMRGWGWDHDRIAAHYGIKRDSLLTRCRRADVYIPEAGERATFERLQQLIASGRPFTSDDLPHATFGVRGAAILHAKRRGLIVPVGTRPANDGHANRLHIWQAAVQMAVSA